MKKSLIFGTFMLSALVWAGAQQPGSAAGQGGTAPGQSGAQSTTPGAGAGPSSSTMPSAGQSSTAPDAGSQATPQAGGSAAANAPITEGCLGGSNPNYTLTDKAGTTYKLTLPANADGTKLAPHVGESVQVLGPVSGSSINVSQIGKGNGTCPGK